MTRRVVSFRFDEKVVRELEGMRNRSRVVEQLVIDGINRRRSKGEVAAWYLVTAVGFTMALGSLII